MDFRSILRRVRGITDDSRKVKEGYLFFALRGTRYDGHAFVRDAVRRGAWGVVVEEPLLSGVPELVVRDTRKALGLGAHIFFGEPSRALKVVGVTGTNGKTSTTHVIASILTSAGHKTGLIGSIHYRVGEKVIGEGRTTPGAVEWHSLLARMLKEGATHAVADPTPLTKRGYTPRGLRL